MNSRKALLSRISLPQGLNKKQNRSQILTFRTESSSGIPPTVKISQISITMNPSRNNCISLISHISLESKEQCPDSNGKEKGKSVPAPDGGMLPVRPPYQKYRNQDRNESQ
jgi:hypothetical protein